MWEVEGMREASELALRRLRDRGVRMAEVQHADAGVEVEEEVAIDVLDGAASSLVDREGQRFRIEDRGALVLLLEAEQRQGLRARRFDGDARRVGEVQVLEPAHAFSAAAVAAAGAGALCRDLTAGLGIAFSFRAFATRPTVVR